jgi:copper chaperone
MHEFEVPDMSCRSCAGKISKAIREVDPQAQVDVDLASKRVRVDSTGPAPEELSAAIAQVGYTPSVQTQGTLRAGAEGNGISCCGGCR